MHLRIIVTGGTFDKEYDEVHGRLFFLRSHVEEMLQRGRCKLRVEIDELMMLDSLDMTASHREQIVGACRDCAESHMVVTHGTDTMVETARVLAEAQLGKTIVLTGAMIPYAFGSSDGLFNLGSALSFAQALPVGVYIAMNGRWFHHNHVRKNRELGVFEAIPLADERNPD